MQDSSPRDDAVARVPPRSWYALAVLVGIYAMHAVDRSVMSVLMEPVKREFGLSDGQAGALNAMTHGIAFAIGVVPISLLGDRVRRTRLIALLVAAWSGLTITCGFTTGAAALAASRAGVGFSEAGFSPTALSMVSDLFPARRRSTAVGLFYGATAIGTGLIFILGAVVAARYGWRAAFFAAGAPGLVLAILMLTTVAEPARGRFYGGERSSGRLGLRPSLAVIATNAALRDGIAGTVLGTMAVASVFAWGTSFFTRYHGLDLHGAGSVMALVAGVMMGIASAVAGPVNDWIIARNPRQKTVLPAAALLASVPVGILALSSASLSVAVAGLALYGFLQGAWLAQGFGTVLAASDPRLRGGIMGVTQLFSNLLGTGLGPLLVGLVSDRLGGDAGSLRAALCGIVLLAVPGAVLLWRAGRIVAPLAEG